MAIATLFMASYTSRVTGWYVMTDELQHVKLSLSIWDSLSLAPHVRGVELQAYSQLYPLLTAPFFGLLDMPTAFDAVHLLNALLMASSAVPVYFLGKTLGLSRWLALASATGAVFVPWTVMSTMVMLEPAAYPAFLWALLAMVRALLMASAQRDFLALLAIGIAASARTQLLVLFAVYAACAVAAALDSRDAQSEPRGLRAFPRRLLRGHPILLVATALAAAAWLLGTRLADVLGNYGTTTEGDLFPPGLARSAAVHLDWIVVGVGVLPLIFSLAFVLRGMIRPWVRSERVFAVVSVLTVAAMTVQVTSFNLRFSAGGAPQDRYLFYIAPILLLGMALAIERRIHPGWVAAAVIPVGWLIGLASYEQHQTAFFAQPAVVFHRVLDGEVWRIGHWFGFDDLSPTEFFKYVPGVLAVLGAIALRSRWRPAAAAVLGIGVLAYCTAETWYTFDRVVDTREGSVGVPESATTSSDDWIDAAVGDDVVGLVPSSGDAKYPPPIWWNAEFWNKTVERSYGYEGSESYTPFATPAIVLSPRTGRLSSPEGLPEYLVIHDLDLRFRPVGGRVAGNAASNPHLALSLYQLRTPPRAAATAQGLGYEGVIQKGARLTVFGPAASGPRVVELEVDLIGSAEIDPALPRGPQAHRKYELVAGTRTEAGSLAPGQTGTARLDLCIAPRRPVDVQLLSTGRGFYGAAPGIPGLPIGVRVSDFRTRTLDRPCDPRA